VTPRAAQSPGEVLIVAAGGTTGWRASTRELAAAFALAGAPVRTALAAPPPEVRTFMLTDLVQALAARRAGRRAIARC